MLIKRLVKDMAEDPKVRMKMEEAIEPISKVINNKL